MASIELANPELLLLAPLFITLTLIGHYFAHRIKRSLEVFHFPPVQRLSRIVAKKGLRSPRWRSISLALKLVVILLITFVLANPTLLTFSETRETVEVPMTMEKDVAGQIILAIDVSASMGLADIKPSRLEMAKHILVEFVQNASGSVRFGIVAFESKVTKTLAPTQDKNRVVPIIENLTSAQGMACLEEYTDIGYGLQVSEDLLAPFSSPSNKSSAIILVSDGYTNYGSPDPFESVHISTKRANATGVPIHALHVSNLGQDSNDELMRQIAAETKGKYMDSTSSDQLREVLTLMGKYYVPTHEWSSQVEVSTTVPIRSEIGFILMFIASAFILVLWVGNYRHYKTAF